MKIFSINTLAMNGTENLLQKLHITKHDRKNLVITNNINIFGFIKES